MRLLDLTLGTPEENLALDEALVGEAESAGRPHETLRLWEPAHTMVVVGCNSRISEEVQTEYCSSSRIPILRRLSGGAAVVAGPGCLMYSLVLSYESRPWLRAVDEAHVFVLSKILGAVRPLAPDASRQAVSDLTLGTRKFSGNSLRCKRTHFLYHGTLLYRFPIECIGKCLREPPRQPDYRAGRPHELFVANLPCTTAELRHAISDAWQPLEPAASWPESETARLVAEKYSMPDWNGRR